MGENEEVVTSPDTTETDEQAVETTEAETGADSSSETPDGDKADLLSVVRDAVGTEEDDGEADDPDSPAGQEESESSSESDDGSEQEAAEPDDENFTDVPFHKHPRFKALVQQRNHFRQGHEQFAALQNYMREMGLENQDVADSLQVAALLRSDPEAAWKRLQPIVQDILHQTGRMLPQDLKARVQSGELSQQDALELSRARASQTVSETRSAHAQRTQASVQQHEASRAMQSAAASWETQMRGRDADFDKKAEDLHKEVLWRQRRDGMPTDARGVQTMLEDAYKSVNERFAKAQPKKPAKKPVTNGGGSGGTTPRKPESVLDIVQAAGGAG